jgi:hypothetical protein
VARAGASKTVALVAIKLPPRVAKAGTDTEVGPTSVHEALVVVKPERVTSEPVIVEIADIVATEPRLTVVPDITVDEAKAVKPAKLTAHLEVIDNAFAEVTPARVTSPSAVIVTCPEKALEPNEN